jgi:hypothetical protein
VSSFYNAVPRQRQPDSSFIRAQNSHAGAAAAAVLAPSVSPSPSTSLNDSRYAARALVLSSSLSVAGVFVCGDRVLGTAMRFAECTAPIGSMCQAVHLAVCAAQCV